MFIWLKSIRGEIFTIIIVFAIGLIAVLAITAYGMKTVSLVVPFLRGERVANAIPVRDAEIYFKEYLLTGSEESKEGFFRAHKIAVAGGVYGELIEESPNVPGIEAEINRRMLTPGYEKDALTSDEVARLVPASFRFRKIKKFRTLIELAHTHGEKLNELLPAFKQLVEIKESPMENGVKKERERAAQLQLETLFEELNLLGAQFSEHTGQVAYLIVNLITYTLLSVIVIFILIGSVIGLLISRHITRPLSKIVVASKKVAQGNLTHQVEIKSENELGDLANSFNQMTKELKKSKDEIEDYSKMLKQKVEERTRELERAKAEIENVMQSQTDLVFVVDTKGIILKANRAVFYTLGYKEDEVVGKSAAIVFHPDTIKEDMEAGPKKAISGKIVTNTELTLMHKDGRKFPFSFNGTPLRDANGNIIGAIGVGRDLREIRKLISQLREAKTNLEEQVKDRTKELQNKVDEIEKFNKLAIGRELKMIELKKEVNKLKRELAGKE